ncbi:calcyphosin-2-like [Mytilus trossulus]|uniref:calcyphosin-2-like n=1 Tax=Mytilus trossulus TaxID=6551 RepID=UPI003007A3A5
MSFMIQDSPTSRYNQQNRPGSASRRPGSSINPITGEETPAYRPPSTRPQSRPPTRPFSLRPEGVPELDLHCFKAEPKTVLPEQYDYVLDSGRSGVSTISWGTDTERSYRDYQENDTGRGNQGKQGNHGYQGYHGNQASARSARNNIDEDFKHLKLKTEEDVKPAKKKTYGEIRKEVEEEEDYLDQNWSKRKPASKAEMLKKMDAEELLEHNKQQKLIETVMIDQLSRPVISDPDQDSRLSVPVSERPHRGSQRMLHSTKMRTKNTTTENMLSKRVRFGARILSRNGHDALRELTGFFFHFDNTLTIYEFRQFGKSAKALPFVTRGRYGHIQGPREDDPYNLTDIFSGNEIIIETRGQHSLPDTVKKRDRVYFKITDVDEEEKQILLQEETYRSQNKQEMINRRILDGVQEEVRERLKKRGIKTVTGLGRYYRKLDKTGSGVLYKFELEKGMFTFHIELPPQDLDQTFDVLDPDETGELDYSIYMRGVIGQMVESRKNLVRKAFRKIDSQKRGVITVSEIKKYFNASFQPPYKQGATPGVSSLKAFLEAITSSPNQEEITYVEFEEYYEGLSISVDDNNEFANILHNTWNI